MMQTSTQLISAWPYAKPRIVLREQLLSQSNLPPSPRDHAKTMHENSSPTSPSDQGNNDLATGGSGVMSTSADSDGGADNGGDGRKGYGKRELSTSKRAAQNRAAQVSQFCFRVLDHVFASAAGHLLQTSTGCQHLGPCWPVETMRCIRVCRLISVTLLQICEVDSGRLLMAHVYRELSASGKKATSRNSKNKSVITKCSTIISKPFKPKITNCETTSSISSHGFWSLKESFHLHPATLMACIQENRNK